MAVFICPSCKHKQDAPDAYVGRSARCNKCQTKGKILAQEPAPPISLAEAERKRKGIEAGNLKGFRSIMTSELSTLRSMVDLASKWLVFVLKFELVLTWILQVCFAAYWLTMFVVDLQDGLGAFFHLVVLAMISVILWASYFLLKIQLGMVAAVLLIEHNTRES